MGVSFREGNEQGGGGRGRGRGGNRYRKTLNGNYIKQGGEDTNEDSTRPQVSNGRQWYQQHDAHWQPIACAQYTGPGRQCGCKQHAGRDSTLVTKICFHVLHLMHNSV